MKRLLIALVVLVAVFALVLPASAVELQFGGLYWTKYYHTNNLRNGDDDIDDQIDGFYTRMRLYFTGVQSENVKVVSRFEIDNVWGQDALGSQSADDKDKWEVKNLYLDFNVPDTPVNMKVGTLAYKLGGGTVFNDDTSAITADMKFDPVRVGLVYSRLGSGPGPNTGSSSTATGTNQHDDTNLWGFDARYQMSEAMRFAFALGYFEGPSGAITPASSPDAVTTDASDDFSLVVLALDVDYKADIFNLYFTAAMDYGEDKGLDPDGTGVEDSVDYQGYFVTFGGTFNATDMIDVGLDFYYASGDDDPGDDDIDSFQTFGGISRPSYNMDEAVFPGWFDDETGQTPTIGGGPAITNNLVSASQGTQAGFFPANMLAIGAHADLKPADTTFIQVGLAYMMPVEDVVTDDRGTAITTDDKTDDDPYGTSVYARLKQDIVDGVQLKVGIGYFFTDDGYSPSDSSDDAYRVAMGLFYNW